MDITVGGARPELDQRLCEELDVVNSAATAPVPAAQELTVSIEVEGLLVAGISGWTWGEAAGIGMTWVAAGQRGSGVGARLLGTFEAEARRRGAHRIFVTSFTFQAPGFYEKQGYSEIFRWQGVPYAGHDDVHFRKDL